MNITKISITPMHRIDTKCTRKSNDNKVESCYIINTILPSRRVQSKGEGELIYSKHFVLSAQLT